MTDTKMVVGKVHLEANVTQEFVNDVMCTAFDTGYGGCWFWMKTYKICTPVEETGAWNREDYKAHWGVEYSFEALSKGATLKVILSEGNKSDEDVEYELTLEKFLQGLNMWVAKCNVHGRPLPVENGELDAGELDANDADLVVQYALFGEVIFG